GTLRKDASRFLKRSFCWVAVLLILGVTGLEAPELLSLGEDVCNEPAMAKCVEKLASRLRSDRATPQRRASRSRANIFGAGKFRNLASIVLLPSKVGRGLLRLLVLQRV